VKRKHRQLLKALGVWIVGGYAWDVIVRSQLAANAAREHAASVGKPVLSVGAGTPQSSLAAFLGFSPRGDINLDLAGEGPCSIGTPHGTTCAGDAHDLSAFPDKHFGAVLATHILEHVDDPDRALSEWHRVADRVYVVTPGWGWLHTWAHPGHKWVFAGGVRTRLWK
jgi:SAM-dependent methyltransferase